MWANNCWQLPVQLTHLIPEVLIMRWWLPWLWLCSVCNVNVKFSHVSHRHHHSGGGRHAASLNIPLILQSQWHSQTNGGIHRPPTTSGNVSLLSCHRIPPAGFNVRSMANKSFSVNDQKTEKNFHFMFSFETWLNSTTAAAMLIIFISQLDRTGSEEGLQPFCLHSLCEGTPKWVSVISISFSWAHCTLYQPPRCSSVFMQKLSELIW